LLLGIDLSLTNFAGFGLTLYTSLDNRDPDSGFLGYYKNVSRFDQRFASYLLLQGKKDGRGISFELKHPQPCRESKDVLAIIRLDSLTVLHAGLWSKTNTRTTIVTN
jgi:hypothetical protein